MTRSLLTVDRMQMTQASLVPPPPSISLPLPLPLPFPLLSLSPLPSLPAFSLLTPSLPPPPLLARHLSSSSHSFMFWLPRASHAKRDGYMDTLPYVTLHGHIHGMELGWVSGLSKYQQHEPVQFNPNSCHRTVAVSTGKNRHTSEWSKWLPYVWSSAFPQTIPYGLARPRSFAYPCSLHWCHTGPHFWLSSSQASRDTWSYC